ncbi:MAG: hypothetical protein ACUVTD_09605 [Nitrososphaerales archaeon]
MLKDSFENRLLKFADKHGKEGFLLLTLYKVIKKGVISVLVPQGYSEEELNRNKILNKECLQLAKKMLTEKGDVISEDNVKDLIRRAFLL